VDGRGGQGAGFEGSGSHMLDFWVRLGWIGLCEEGRGHLGGGGGENGPDTRSSRILP
jgi:hypothetical protein